MARIPSKWAKFQRKCLTFSTFLINQLAKLEHSSLFTHLNIVPSFGDDFPSPTMPGLGRQDPKGRPSLAGSALKTPWHSLESGAVRLRVENPLETKKKSVGSKDLLVYENWMNFDGNQSRRVVESWFLLVIYLRYIRNITIQAAVDLLYEDNIFGELWKIDHEFCKKWTETGRSLRVFF